MGKVVFTNGCFDLLHVGHVRLLKWAKNITSDCKLIVGLNCDGSVELLKGKGRPIFCHYDRKEVLEALECVDEVRIFAELTPQVIINEIKPDFLVKGEDWKGRIVGQKFVESYGGVVLTFPLIKGRGYATSDIIRHIKHHLKKPLKIKL